MSAKCIQCEDAATVRLKWPTSRGVQSGVFCHCCAEKWWTTYKHADAGESATFSPIDDEEGERA